MEAITQKGDCNSILKMVTGIQAKIEGTTVKLTWNKVSGADKYGYLFQN